MKFGIERLIVEKQLYRYSSKGLKEDKLEKKIAEVGLNAYGYISLRNLGFDLSG